MHLYFPRSLLKENSGLSPRKPTAVAAEEEPADEIRRPPLRCTQRHVEADEVFGVQFPFCSS